MKRSIILLICILTIGIIADIAIPKRYFWATSTYMSDSTNYVTLNKGFYSHDSVKVGSWLLIGTLHAGGIYLDTNQMGRIYYVGNSLYIEQRKRYGYTYLSFGADAGLSINSNLNGALTEVATIDTSTFIMKSGNIQTTQAYQQVKLQGDTATDYDANDAITLNRQSGTLTTKALTTAALGDYNLTLTNSLISATTKVFCTPTTGSLTTGIPLVRAAVSGSGSATIVIYNASAANAFNGTVGFNFLVINNP